LTSNEKELMSERFVLRLQTRVNEMLATMDLPRWETAEMHRFAKRMRYVVGDNLTDRDLHVLVRVTNREFLGRRACR
jgi:hypothetical protein